MVGTKKQKQKQNKTKQKKKKKQPQCGNTCEQILLNEPRKHWHQYMDSGLAHLQNDIFLESIQ